MEALSKLMRESAISNIDEWRSYSYMKASGRLKYLDFDVTNHPDVWKRLKHINGFGKSIIDKLKEYLLTGKCERMTQLQQDPGKYTYFTMTFDRNQFVTNFFLFLNLLYLPTERIAVRKMTHIWGIGRKKVSTSLQGRCIHVS